MGGLEKVVLTLRIERRTSRSTIGRSDHLSYASIPTSSGWLDFLWTSRGPADQGGDGLRGGAGGETRTPDLLLTRQLLYRLSYAGKLTSHGGSVRRAVAPSGCPMVGQEKMVGPGGFEPPASRLSGVRSTPELQANREGGARRRRPSGVWSGQRGSNPRHPVWKTGALPTELHPHSVLPGLTVYIGDWPPIDVDAGAASGAGAC